MESLLGSLVVVFLPSAMKDVISNDSLRRRMRIGLPKEIEREKDLDPGGVHEENPLQMSTKCGELIGIAKRRVQMCQKDTG